MYYYSGFVGFMGFVTIAIAIIVLIAWIISVYMFVERAKEKNPKITGTGSLWFMGIFASPVVLGLYVISRPDARQRVETHAGSPAAMQDELPSV